MAKKKPKLSLTEALDALSYLAEIHDVEKSPQLPLPDVERSRSISFIVTEISKDAEISEDKIREIFKVILGHVKKLSENNGDKGKLEKVKSIMMMVGEATTNIDRYTSLFELKSGQSVTQFAEYKRLQEFYTKRVEKQVDESLLSRWIVPIN